MKLHSFIVLPNTPKKLQRLHELAYNLYFSWNPDVLHIFEQLDHALWQEVHANPIQMLCKLPQDTLQKAATNSDYLVEVETVYERFRDYMDSTTWHERHHGKSDAAQIAYFSAEFALHEALPTYSGGLGVLAGDHIKTASDLGLPLVAVGLLYRQGYFQQTLTPDGIQQEAYPENNWHSMPVHLVTSPEGTPVRGEIMLAERPVGFHIWEVHVGRVTLYLLDTNLEDNSAEHRDITKSLYDPDRTIRLQQEILLGIGGVRALRLLGHTPKAYHINEGHSAFLLLESIRQRIHDQGLSFAEARELVWAAATFTTHTPVAAGNERFQLPLMEKYFAKYVADLKISWEDFVALGMETTHDDPKTTTEFSMTALALRLSARANGVSQLHGMTSRKIWQPLFPDIPENEIPIGHVVNGVHTRTWLSPHLHTLLQRHVPRSIPSDLLNLHLWEAVDRIKDKDLWDIKCLLKTQLIDFVHTRLRSQYRRSGMSVGELNIIGEILQPNVLTIGFARRFTAYKRAYLLFQNVDRLKSILCHPRHPVQIIIAGKAHPADQRGKDIIRRIHEIASDPDLHRHIVFVENYDIHVAQHLVQGVDVWLNTPLRPLEASGTSGMKAAMNGGLNLSILDGWWDEAYDPACGWAIGGRDTYADQETQDAAEIQHLYRLLEHNVVPLYYRRDRRDLPLQWVQMMRAAIRSLGERFNAHRMVREYLADYYHPALLSTETLQTNDCANAKELAAWRSHVQQAWHQVAITRMEADKAGPIRKGEEITVRAWVTLGAMAHTNVTVECYHGPLNTQHHIVEGAHQSMTMKIDEGTQAIFETTITCAHGGEYGFSIRAVPGHPLLAGRTLPGLMKWYE